MLYVTLERGCFELEVGIRAFPNRVDLRIILKWILNKWNMSVWAEFIWFTVGASGRLDIVR